MTALSNLKMFAHLRNLKPNRVNKESTVKLVLRGHHWDKEKLAL
jgi:hypothetical protein